MITNRGKYRILQSVFRRVSTPTGFYLALADGTVPVTAAINTWGQLSEINAGNGYTAGGQAVSRNSTDFPTLADYPATGYAEIALKNFSWSASGGTIPSSSPGAEWLCLLDNNATPANRDVLTGWDYGFEKWDAGTFTANSKRMRLWDNSASSGWTTGGLELLLDYFFRGATMPTNFYVALVTNATAPSWSTTTLSGLTQIAAGNGYTSGGISLNPNSTDFDNLVENDTNNRAELQIKDLSWTASGGPIPSSGSGASYAVLTDDNGTVGSRVVFAWWNLGSARSATDGQQIILRDLELRLTAAQAMP